jgi:alanine racemase
VSLTLAQHRPTWAEVDLDVIAANLATVRQRLGATAVLAIVKADAYGHGAVPVAGRLEREGVAWLGVALPEEGVELRRAGIATPILVLGGFAPAQAGLLLDHRLTPAVFRPEQVEALAAAAAARGVDAEVHVKIDTGMGRLGVPTAGLAGFADRLAAAARLRVTGAFSHLAVADEPDDPFTAAQLQDFLRSVNLLRGRGLHPGLLHLANSPAITDHRAAWMTLARPGLLLYGYNPGPRSATLPVRPALTLKSRIVDVRQVAAGASVGYGRTWRPETAATVATLGLGYADGLPRSAGNRGHVLVHGRRAPIVGRINMDLTTIDISAIPEAAIDDIAVVIGRAQGDGAGADALAAAAGTIPWEILARLGGRIPRLHLEGGRATLASRFAAPLEESDDAAL